eukprot:TRINITY_DN3827_c0_g1_i2.p1 TRINITY_DN3827_c0_g1~~TRINITY_DN3827_c0_g1_i2.p1  ORF type:complete len:122 (-),score=3.51 TRINITY_DN3827_c0_g1_i2:85-450(-)
MIPNTTKSKYEDTVGDAYEVPERIDILVTQPENHEKDGKKWTSFKINVTTNLPEYDKPEFSVRRRYSEFEALRAHLKKQVENNSKTKGSLRRVPELPGKNLTSELFLPNWMAVRVVSYNSN